MTFARPRPIVATDEVAQFECGERTLDNWLNLRAIKNEADGNSRTFVSIERESGLIAGYYCLSSNSLARDMAPGSLRRNAPDPIPTILIGRLAVDHRFQGMGVGASLLQNALMKGIEAAEIIGSRAFLVDALNESATTFYSRFGFESLPGSERLMYMRMKDVFETVHVVAATVGS